MKFPFCGRPSWAFLYVSAMLSGRNFSNFRVISYSHLWFYWYSQTVSNMAVSIYTFLPCYLTNSWYRHTFRLCKSGGYEIVSRRKLNLLSMATKEIEHFFVQSVSLLLSVGHSVSYFACSFMFFSVAHFKMECFSFSHWFVGSFYILWVIMLVSYVLQIISPGLYFSFLVIVVFVGQKFSMLSNFSLWLYC